MRLSSKFWHLSNKPHFEGEKWSVSLELRYFMEIRIIFKTSLIPILYQGILCQMIERIWNSRNHKLRFYSFICRHIVCLLP